jgi:hypothetical protein
VRSGTHRDRCCDFRDSLGVGRRRRGLHVGLDAGEDDLGAEEFVEEAAGFDVFGGVALADVCNWEISGAVAALGSLANWAISGDGVLVPCTRLTKVAFVVSRFLSSFEIVRLKCRVNISRRLLAQKLFITLIKTLYDSLNLAYTMTTN